MQKRLNKVLAYLLALTLALTMVPAAPLPATALAAERGLTAVATTGGESGQEGQSGPGSQTGGTNPGTQRGDGGTNPGGSTNPGEAGESGDSAGAGTMAGNGGTAGTVNETGNGSEAAGDNATDTGTGTGAGAGETDEGEEPADDQSDAEDEADEDLEVQQDSTPVTMWRLYNPNSGEHFYTSNLGERDHIVSVGWRLEGVGWVAPTVSNHPVYRLYNPNAGDHHYTLDAGERDWLASLGWNYEGIGWYSDDGQTTAVWRQYNPNAVAGAHNFTTAKDENDYLASVGWRAEGIGWYALAVGRNIAAPSLSYRTQSSGAGWAGWVGAGGTAGNAGQVEQIQAQLSGGDVSGAVQVCSYNAGGWTGWSGDNGPTGAAGTGIQTVQVRLTGLASNVYDVYYRAYVPNFGWMGWAYNGQNAGTSGYNCFITSLQIVLVEKGANAPGSTVGAYAHPSTRGGSPSVYGARGEAIIDNTGAVLWSQSPTTRYQMASTTKVMTAMVALDSGLQMGQSVGIPGGLVGWPYSVAGYRWGTATVNDLMQTMLISSACDSAQILAIAAAGSQGAFVDRMNRKAAQIGLTNTHFSNVYGRDEADNYTSAADLAAMGRYAMEHYPVIASIVGMGSATVYVNGGLKTVHTTNQLLGQSGVIGIKTGSEGSGYDFVGAADRNGRRVYIAVLGSGSSYARWHDARAMFDWALG